MNGKDFRNQIETATGLRKMVAGASTSISRRKFIGYSLFAAGWMADKAVDKLAIDPFVDPLLEKPMPRHFATPTSLKALETMPGTAPVRVAAEAWREKQSIEHVVGALRKAGQDDRFTVAELDSMGRLCITCQGAGARRLWDYDLIGRPMGDRPDNPALGAFLHERYREAMAAADPMLQNVVLFPGKEGLPGKFRYVGFAASDGRRVIGVTVPSDRARFGSGSRDPEGQGSSGRPATLRQRTTRPAELSV